MGIEKAIREVATPEPRSLDKPRGRPVGRVLDIDMEAARAVMVGQSH